MTNSSFVLIGAWLALLLSGCAQEPIRPLGDWALTRTAQNRAGIFPTRLPATPSPSAVPEPTDARHPAITLAPVRATPVTTARAIVLAPTLSPASTVTSVATSTRPPSLAPTVPASPRPPMVTPSNTPSATAPVAILPPGQVWGVAVAFSGNADAQRAALDRAQELGVGWVKHQLLWSSVEGSRQGEFQWAAMDAIAREVHARGLRLLVSVVAAPDWARPAGDDRSVHGLPADPQDLATFLSALVTRYRGTLHALEIWNEPNLWLEVGGRGRISPAAYLSALRASYRAVKASAPEVIVISAALAPTGTNDGRTAMDDRSYLRALYSGGLASISDAIGAHPAGYNLPPDADWRTFANCHAFTPPCASRHPSWSFAATLADYHAIAAESGDGAKAVWATEFGWAASLGKRIKGYAYADDNSPWQAGQYVRQALALAKDWPWVGALFYWNLNYAAADGLDSERALFSLLDVEGYPRAAFDALKAAPR